MAEFREIISISGQPGLFRFLAQGAHGLIVESLADGRRMNATGSAKVSALSEIAIFTDSGELPLGEIFERIKKRGNVVSAKASNDELKKFFGEVVPDYDHDRVHVSDIKKVASWFAALSAAGMDDFSLPEESENPE